MPSVASRVLYCLLALHLAHVPVPVWDGDHLCDGRGGVEYAASAMCALWDVDVLLLGVLPPDDLDEGPFGSIPEYPERSVFGDPYALVRGHSDALTGLVAHDGSLGMVLTPLASHRTPESLGERSETLLLAPVGPGDRGALFCVLVI